MAGDFSRSTFDPRKHYQRVLMQQGRVQVDADWNEQIAIAEYLQAAQFTDTIGLSGTPQEKNGFLLTTLQPSSTSATTDFQVVPGRIYVNGVQCVLDPPTIVRCTASGDGHTLQLASWLVDGQPFAPNQWVVPIDGNGIPIPNSQRNPPYFQIASIDSARQTIILSDPLPGTTISQLYRVPTYTFQPSLLVQPQPADQPTWV